MKNDDFGDRMKVRRSLIESINSMCVSYVEPELDDGFDGVYLYGICRNEIVK